MDADSFHVGKFGFAYYEWLFYHAVNAKRI